MVAVGAHYFGAQLVSLRHIHSGLQGCVSRYGRAHPCGVTECDTFERDALHGIVRRALHAQQCFNRRHLNIGIGHRLSLSRHIVHLLLPGIKIPFSRSVEQLLGIGKIERRVMSVRRHHRRRPRVHEMDVAFGLVKRHRRTVALHLYTLHAQICHAPHFVEHHFGMLGVEHTLHCRCRNIENLVLLVHTAYAVHLLEVFHVPRPVSLFAVHPELAELERPAVELRHIGDIEFSLLLPSRDFHSAANHGVAVSHDVRAVILGAHHDSLVKPVRAGLQTYANVVSPVEPPFFPCLLQSLFQGIRTGLHRYVGCRSRVCRRGSNQYRGKSCIHVHLYNL